MCEEWLNGVKGKWAKITEHFQVCAHRYELLLVLFGWNDQKRVCETQFEEKGEGKKPLSTAKLPPGLGGFCGLSCSWCSPVISQKCFITLGLQVPGHYCNRQKVATLNLLKKKKKKVEFVFQSYPNSKSRRFSRAKSFACADNKRLSTTV